MGTTLFAYAKGVWKSLFRCGTHKETKLWMFFHVMLKRSFVIFFFHGFHLCLWWSKVVVEITYPETYSLVCGKEDGANLSLCSNAFVSYNHFSKHL